MSVTTTQNPQTYSIARTLADYNLHHSELDSEEHDATLNHRPTATTASVVDSWETEYRRVPQPRPIDRELDFDSRNTTLNNIERFFLFNMFGGILIVQVRPHNPPPQEEP